MRLVKDDMEGNQEIKILEDEKLVSTQMIPIPDEKINNINSSCSYCHSIFLGDFKAFQCENCGSYYHEPCLQKMNKEINACRYCG